VMFALWRVCVTMVGFLAGVRGPFVCPDPCVRRWRVACKSFIRAEKDVTLCYSR